MKQKIDLNGKTIVVTGGAGFIGSNLIMRLLRDYDNITIINIDSMTDYNSVELKKWRLKQVEATASKTTTNHYLFIRGDIADKDLIDKIFSDYNIEIVVNLAAQAGVRYSIDHPDAYINSNIIGFYNIVEACRHSYPSHPAKDGYKGVEHLVYASSSSVYGGNEKVPFSTEDSVDHPVSLYAATKKSDELLAHAYSKIYNIPSTGLRFFTVYGPAGRTDMAYYSFTEKLVKGEKIDIFNNGDMKRDFTFVDDIVEGIVRVMQGAPRKATGADGLPVPPYAIYNIGGGQPESLMDFVHIISEELMDAEVLDENFRIDEHLRFLPMQPGDVPITYADSSGLERDYGFKPSIDLRTGLGRFAMWYKEYRDGRACERISDVIEKGSCEEFEPHTPISEKRMMGKTLLILGNGFDLAHSLPTRYADFLEFSNCVLQIYKQGQSGTKEEALRQYKSIYLEQWGKDEKTSASLVFIKNELEDLFKNRKYKEYPIPENKNVFDFEVHTNDRMDLLYGYLKENIWYKYINQIYKDRKIKGENWIDFESEISYIIQKIDAKHESLSQKYEEVHNHLIHDGDTNGKLTTFYENCDKCCGGRVNAQTTVRQMREKLYDDLEKLTYAFEIYLTDVIEQIPLDSKIGVIDDLKPDYVVSFNYTKTYENMYNSSVPVCHIHGICDGNRKTEDNNMVLGIDKYSSVTKESQEDFSIFKKFVQRIRKHNDVSYSSWAEEIEEIGEDKRPTVKDVVDGYIVSTVDEFYSDIYIFGHSLDITDKDILYRFLANDATRIHIFIRDKGSEGELISNLIKITSEDIVVQKSTHNPPLIEFCK